MLPGVRIKELRKIPDERGFFAEILREDWEDLLGPNRIAQANLSMTYSGIIRAWHRHTRGQIDCFIVVRGALRICAYDDQENSETRGQLDEILSSSEKLQAVRIPGHYWHGIKTVSSQPSLTLYLTNRLYDHQNPDEERRPWNDPTIVDPRTGKSYDWDKLPHR
ncbi:MAG: dTDP-4-dehydrorhamnose 3,5-epimerase family protein [Candidatus Geothermarchaeales archaeon]